MKHKNPWEQRWGRKAADMPNLELIHFRQEGPDGFWSHAAIILEINSGRCWIGMAHQHMDSQYVRHHLYLASAGRAFKSRFTEAPWFDVVEQKTSQDQRKIAVMIARKLLAEKQKELEMRRADTYLRRLGAFYNDDFDAIVTLRKVARAA